MIQEINEFVNLVTNGDPNRTELAVMPLAQGDVIKLVKVERRTVGDNAFAACYNTDESQMLSANALLRKGNGINYDTDNLQEAANTLFTRINSETGLTLTVAKVYKCDNNRGTKTTYYRFEPVNLIA